VGCAGCIFAGTAGAGVAGAPLAGALCAQTAAAGKKSRRAGAILRPRMENAVIFIIIQGNPNELNPVKRVERTQMVETRRGQPGRSGSRATLPTVKDDFTRQ
jgi:hypothetical protein